MAQIRWIAYWTFRFHSRMAPSSLPLASVCPSGLNATESTGGAAGQGLAERAGVGGIGEVPQPDRAVGAAAGQRLPVGAERHRGTAARAAGQGLAERAGVRGIGDVPQPDRAVGAAAGQRVPVGAERHRVDGAGAAGQGLPRGRVRGIGDVPQPDRAVVAAAGQRAPVGAERHRVRRRPCCRSGAGRGAGVAGRRRPTAGSCRRRLPLASVRPSGLKPPSHDAAAAGQGPAERRGCAGSARSHSRIVPSALRWPACARRG